VIATAGLLALGISTGIPNDLDVAARKTGLHLIEAAKNVPEGDAGFTVFMEKAFTFSTDNFQDSGPVLSNRAAILALGVILGDERVASVAKRQVDLDRLAEVKALRSRITLSGRQDLSRHFWVSAALTLLSGNERSMAVGLAKELMDATPGGSGFSFPDLVADRAGNLFALAATRDERSARVLRNRILGGIRADDYFPDVSDLPENLSRGQFQERFGGLGGKETRRVVEEIRRRLAACNLLR